MCDQQKWLAMCQFSIQNFVETQTRHEVNQLTLELIEAFDCQYQIKLDLGFTVRKESEKVAGRVKDNAKQLVFKKQKEYEAALSAEIQKVKTRPENSLEAHRLVEENPYGALKEETCIYEHDRCVCVEEACETCKGKGKVKCSPCSGSGKVNCSSCGGNGYTTYTDSYYDSATKTTRYETRTRSCGWCHYGKVKCSGCKGSGKVSCKKCKATGVFTKMDHLFAYVVPHYSLQFLHEDIAVYIPEGLHKAGLPNLGEYGHVMQIDSVIQRASNTVHFLYEANCPFARYVSDLPVLVKEHNQEVLWIVYGTVPQVLDAGHVIEVMLKSDLDDLYYTALPKKLRNPFVGMCSRQAVQTFMQSEVNQRMLEANADGIKEKELREELNRSVSETYIKEALGSLRSITSAIQKWWIVKWGLFMGIVAYFALPYLGYTSRAKSIVEGKTYLTPELSIFEFSNAIKSIAGNYLYYFIKVALVVWVVAYIWKRIWIFFRFPNSFSYWARKTGLIEPRIITMSLLGFVLFSVLLMLFPITVSEKGKVFGVAPQPFKLTYEKLMQEAQKSNALQQQTSEKEVQKPIKKGNTVKDKTVRKPSTTTQAPSKKDNTAQKQLSETLTLESIKEDVSTQDNTLEPLTLESIKEEDSAQGTK